MSGGPGVEALARALHDDSVPWDGDNDHFPDSTWCDESERHWASRLLAALSPADRLVIAGITPEALDAAMVAVWPSHQEGTGGTGDAPTTTWDIVDPALPSKTLARAILAALTDPAA